MQDIKKEYDVVVVGAGPSGAATAKGLVDKGLKVLVVEKKKLPRYKICSGLIFKRSQDITNKHFGIIPDHVFVRPRSLLGVRMWTDGGKSFNDWPFDLTKGEALNVWRSEFDYWLIKNTGAEVLDPWTLVDFRKKGRDVEIVCSNNKDESLNIRCKFLVSAEGSLSTIRAKLDPCLEKSLEWFIAYQNYCEGVSTLDPNYYHAFTDKNFGEVYAWFNVKDDLLVFGTAIKKGDKIRPYLINYTRFLGYRFGLKLNGIKRKVSCVGSNMCSTNRFLLGRDNILLVGEAAGFLNMFGEGISSALSTGLLASQAIYEGLNSGKEAISIYEAMAEVEKKNTVRSWKLAEKIAGRRLM